MITRKDSEFPGLLGFNKEDWSTLVPPNQRGNSTHKKINKESSHKIYRSTESSITQLELLNDSDIRITTRCMRPIPDLKPHETIQFHHKIEVNFKATPIQEIGSNNSFKTFETEERVRYDVTDKFPHSVHGLVKITNENETSSYGTGVIIGLNLVLTAAHIVWDKENRRKHSNERVKFLAGLNGKTPPFGTANVKKIFLSEEYIKTSAQEIPKDDFALLVLDRALGRETGYFGIDIVSKELIKTQRELYVVGYPGRVGDPEYQKLIDSGCYYQYGMKGEPFFDENEPDLIHYTIVTSAGQSGSGVYYHDEEMNEYYVVGIHALGRPGLDSYNSAVWLTRKSFTLIQKWIELSQQSGIDEENLNLSGRCLTEMDVKDKLLNILKEHKNSNVRKLNLSYNKLNCDGATKIIINSQWDSLIEINLSRNNIYDKGAEMIACTNTWENLVKLDLSQNYINDEGAIKIGEHATWRKLEVLILGVNNIRDEGATAIAESTCWPNLRVLSLADNQIKAAGAVAIGNNAFWKELRKLNLSANNISDEGGVVIGNNTFWEKLEDLRLNGNNLGDETAIAIGKNVCWKNLKSLFLKENSISHRGIAEIAKNKTWVNLQVLNLHKNGVSIGNSGQALQTLSDLGSLIGKNESWKNLVKLDLGDNKITSQILKEICVNADWSSFEILNLEKNSISAEGIDSLSNNASWTNLKELNLGANKIGNTGAQHLSNNATWVHLTTLKLYYNDIDAKGAEFLSKNQKWKDLQELDLAGNSIGDDGARYLSQNTTWTKLQLLNLNINKIGQKGASGLSANNTWKELTTLELRFNKLGDEGATKLSMNTSWSKLQMLDLARNNITDAGAESLSKNATWASLRLLKLDSNEIGSKGAASLKKNSTWTVTGLKTQNESSCTLF